MDSEHTLYIYRKDGRRSTGYRLVASQDFDSRAKAESFADTLPKGLYRCDISKSYRMVENIMTGQQVKERADTPFVCSVSSETYWSQ